MSLCVVVLTGPWCESTCVENECNACTRIRITEAYRFVWGWEFMQDVCKKVDAVGNVLMSVGEHLT